MQAFPPFQGKTPLWIQNRFAAAQASCCSGLWFMYGVFDKGVEEEVEVMFSCSPSLAANCPHCMQTLEFFGASRETLTFCLEAINYLDKESRTYPINGSYRLDLSVRLMCCELMSSSFLWATSEPELLIGVPGEN